MKRILAAIVFGLLAGGICATGAFYAGFLKFTAVNLVWILLNRAVMGFAIGVSGLRIHWAWNGVLIGLAVGSLFSFFLYMTLGGFVPLANFFVNGLFGVMIEFFTSVVCKAPSLAAPRQSQRVTAA